MSTTPRFGLTRLVANQATAEVVVNSNENIVSTLLGLSFINMTTTAPPGSPVEGDCYLIAASATGVWTGNDGKVATYFGGWVFIIPVSGTEAFDQATLNDYRFDGTSWLGRPLRGSAALNFPSVAASGSADLTITMTGAALGDVVSLGVPNAAMSANLLYFAWVSAANTVTVRAINNSAVAIDPASATFKVNIWQ